MQRSLLLKNIREARWLLLGCTAAIFAFCWLRVWFVSRLATDRFRTILEMLPGDWRRFLSVDFEWLITYPGRISLAYQELIVVLCVTIWGIARGSDVVSGEINRGTMEMLLAQPISRLRILATHTAVTLAGVTVLAFAAFGGTCAGVYSTAITHEVSRTVPLPLYVPGLGTELPLPFGHKETRRTPMYQKVNVRVFLPATMNLLSLGVLVAGFSSFLSACDRYRWRTIGLAAGTMVVQFILKLAGMASEKLHWMSYLSLLSAYEPETQVRIADTNPPATWAVLVYDAHGKWLEFGPLAYDLLLLGVGTTCLFLAAIVFLRRDLPAPL